MSRIFCSSSLAFFSKISSSQTFQRTTMLRKFIKVHKKLALINWCSQRLHLLNLFSWDRRAGSLLLSYEILLWFAASFNWFAQYHFRPRLVQQRARIRKWGNLIWKRDKTSAAQQGVCFYEYTLSVAPCGAATVSSLLHLMLPHTRILAFPRSPSTNLSSRKSVSRESKAGCGVKNN